MQRQENALLQWGRRVPANIKTLATGAAGAVRAVLEKPELVRDISPEIPASKQYEWESDIAKMQGQRNPF